jgi:hypothetical protein
MPFVSYSIEALKIWITGAVQYVNKGALSRIWTELDYSWDICHVTKEARIAHF